MKFITNERRECGDLILLTGKDMRLPRRFAPRNESAATTQMQWNRLAVLRKKMSIKIVINNVITKFFVWLIKKLMQSTDIIYIMLYIDIFYE